MPNLTVYWEPFRQLYAVDWKCPHCGKLNLKTDYENRTESECTGCLVLADVETLANPEQLKLLREWVPF